MTVKDASVKFNIDEKEIRRRIKDDMVKGIRKDGRTIIIPDDTVLIPSKKEIRFFLMQIIKYKNNTSIAISREICPSDEQLRALTIYLYNTGYIGESNFSSNIRELFDKIQITDKGINLLFGSYANLLPKDVIPLQINPGINLSLISIGV